MQRLSYLPYEWTVDSYSRDDYPHYVTIDRLAIREFTKDERNPDGLDLPGFCTCEHFSTRILPKLRAGQFLVINTCQHIRDVRLTLLSYALDFLYHEKQNRKQAAKEKAETRAAA